MQVAEGHSKQLQALQTEADQELKCQREQLQLKATAELKTLVKVCRADSSIGGSRCRLKLLPPSGEEGQAAAMHSHIAMCYCQLLRATSFSHHQPHHQLLLL